MMELRSGASVRDPLSFGVALDECLDRDVPGGRLEAPVRRVSAADSQPRTPRRRLATIHASTAAIPESPRVAAANEVWGAPPEVKRFVNQRSRRE